jgi:YHS domain-containing protein
MSGMTRSLCTLLVAATLLVACGKTQAPQQAAAPSLTAAQVETKLAAADVADGTADKVVSKCAACKLGMDGDAANASQHAGYTLHFCSEECKHRFDADPNKVLSKLPDKPLA